MGFLDSLKQTDTLEGQDFFRELGWKEYKLEFFARTADPRRFRRCEWKLTLNGGMLTNKSPSVRKAFEQLFKQAQLKEVEFKWDDEYFGVPALADVFKEAQKRQAAAQEDV